MAHKIGTILHKIFNIKIQVKFDIQNLTLTCETAWGEAQKAWETGLGAELDGIIYGVKVINKIFLFF